MKIEVSFYVEGASCEKCDTYTIDLKDNFCKNCGYDLRTQKSFSLIRSKYNRGSLLSQEDIDGLLSSIDDIDLGGE